MRMMPVVVGAGMLALLLGGCAPSAPIVPGGDGARQTPETPSRGGVAPRDQPLETAPETPVALGRDVRCTDGQDVTIDGRGREFRVTGPCGAVTVRGSAITAEIETAASLAIEGQAVVVRVDGDLTALDVRGDANSIEAGSIAAIAVSGQANRIDGGHLGALSIDGDDNTVLGDTEPSPSSIDGQGNVVTRR
ncbi:MAG: DUF3060 domain-containing protein [Leifsonia sp.]